jgi:GH43 family beta-xylosidase
MKRSITYFIILLIIYCGLEATAQYGINRPAEVKLKDMKWRDVCIVADEHSGYYYMVGPAGKSVYCYRSRDLLNWEDGQPIFTIPENFWGDMDIVSIWAPELHHYKGKYYLFLTFDTRNMFQEQWRDWLPRVTRGSQVLVSDAITGPYKPFRNHSTLPVDMMTLDGTLWVEDGTPYMVFCHEWVQITNGSMAYVQLKDDLSETTGEPVKLFHASEASWSNTGKQYGNNVTDGPYLYTGKTGKLYMLWTSGSTSGYTQGIAISGSGKLAGPWIQQDEPVYAKDGGHGMVFKTFEGDLMMVLHSPNNRDAQPRIFRMEDTGNTLKITTEFTN